MVTSVVLFNYRKILTAPVHLSISHRSLAQIQGRSGRAGSSDDSERTRRVYHKPPTSSEERHSGRRSLGLRRADTIAHTLNG